MLRLRLLGSPQISLSGAPLEALSSAKSQALLFYLALSGRAQSRLTLAGLLWPDKSDTEARMNLRQALHQLRQALPEHFVATRDHVALNPDAPLEVDACLFETSLNAGLAGDLYALHAAADRYGGDFLNGFYVDAAPEFEVWQLVERERLRGLALQMLHQLANYHANQHDLAPALQYTSRLLALEPLREEAHQLMMRLLAWNGQISAALAHYSRCRDLFSAELGVKPSDETTALYESIRAGQLTPDRSEVRRPQPAPSHLPPQSTAFIGRARELAALNALQRREQARLITITGPGGMGKTRLALAYAEQQTLQPDRSAFPDGVYFVPFASATLSPDLPVTDQISLTIRYALGLELGGSEGEAALSPKQPLLDYVRDKRLLLVLDNFEEVSGGSLLLTEMLQAAPQIQIVVTSRERLDLYEERVFALHGLTLPDLSTAPPSTAQSEAVQLFISAAQRARHDFEPQPDDWGPLTDICRFLMGMPLALELAAAWVDTLSVKDILHEIRRDLGLLNTDLQNVPPRHRSLNRIFDYTWQRLSPDEQKVLATFSIFQGGFTRSAGQQVAAAAIGAPITPRLLANLVHKALLSYDQTRDRYELHELVRHFAAAKLTLDESQEKTARHLHGTYYCFFLQERTAAFKGPQQQVALAEAEADVENIFQAWHWAVAQRQPHCIAAALDGLFHLFDTRRWFLAGELALREAVLRLGSEPAPADQFLTVARLEARRGWFMFQLGRPEESMRLLRQSLMRLWQQGHYQELAFGLNCLGEVLCEQERYEQATLYLSAALQLAQRLNDRYLISISLSTLGQTTWRQGDHSLARRYCEDGLQIKREIGDRLGLTHALTALGRVAESQGEYVEATCLFEESLSVCQALGDRHGLALAWLNLGDVAATQQHYAAAAQAFQQSVTISRDIGDQAGISRGWIRLGAACAASGELTIGADHIREGLKVALGIGSESLLLSGILAMAEVWHQAAQVDRAGVCLKFIGGAAHLSQAQRQQTQRLRHDLEASATSLSEAIAPTFDTAGTFVRVWVLRQGVITKTTSIANAVLP